MVIKWPSRQNHNDILKYSIGLRTTKSISCQGQVLEAARSARDGFDLWRDPYRQSFQQPSLEAFPIPGKPQAASQVGQDDRSRLGINAARFRALLVQLRPASRRALGRGV